MAVARVGRRLQCRQVSPRCTVPARRDYCACRTAHRRHRSKGGSFCSASKLSPKRTAAFLICAGILDAARNAKLRVFYAMHRRYRPGDFETWQGTSRRSEGRLGRVRPSSTRLGRASSAPKFAPAGRHGSGRTQRAQMRHGWIGTLQRRRTCPRVRGAILSDAQRCNQCCPAARIGRCTRQQ